MPRQARIAPGGIVFHVINRGVGRMTLFEHDDDYRAFLRCMRDAHEHTPVALFCYCIMPNHWHLVLRPREDGDLASYMHRLTLMHARRWQGFRGERGRGHVYQGRYRSFPIQTDEHYLTVARYVERNALRANLCKAAENWPWSSLHQRAGNRRRRESDNDAPPLSQWPVTCPRHWKRLVNTPLNDEELAAVRKSVQRGTPYGGDRWAARTAEELGLSGTLRGPGRPRQPA